MNGLGTPMSRWVSRQARRRPGRIHVSTTCGGSLFSRAVRRRSHGPSCIRTPVSVSLIRRGGGAKGEYGIPDWRGRSARSGASARCESGDLAAREALAPAEPPVDPAFARVIGPGQALRASAVHDDGDPVVEGIRPVPLDHDTASVAGLWTWLTASAGRPSTSLLDDCRGHAVGAVYECSVPRLLSRICFISRYAGRRWRDR